MASPHPSPLLAVPSDLEEEENAWNDSGTSESRTNHPSRPPNQPSSIIHDLSTEDFPYNVPPANFGKVASHLDPEVKPVMRIS